MLFGIVRIEEKDLRHYIKDISTGNKAALMQFYRNYGQSILNMILSTVNSRESAEEVLQDVLMVLVTHNPDQTIKNVKKILLLYKILSRFDQDAAPSRKKKTRREKDFFPRRVSF